MPEGDRRPKREGPADWRGDEDDGGRVAYSDRDCLQLLTREPFSGITPAVYAGLSDRVILSVYLGRRSHEDGTLITEAEQAGGDYATDELARRGRERARQIAAASKALPAARDLGIPGEVIGSRVYQKSPAFVRMFWATWLARGLDGGQVLERWRAAHGGQPVAADRVAEPVAPRPRGARRRGRPPGGGG